MTTFGSRNGRRATPGELATHVQAVLIERAPIAEASGALLD